MLSSVVASLALVGATSALSVGSAHVINKCSYDVYLCNVPSSGGGYQESDKTLSSGGTWDQEWTELSNSNGWSIKLSKTDALENILQYEYTFHNDGTIWYDLSCVNGNPWDGNWEITSSTSNCNPKQQAYRYATDDAYGMQACPQDASITVTLCSGEAADNSTSSGSDSGSDSGSASSSDSGSYPDGYTSVSSSYSTPASTPSIVAPTAYYNWNNADMSASEAAATPTTFATSTTAVVTSAPDGVIVTEVETAVVTDIVTAYGRVKPRHQHHPHGHA